MREEDEDLIALIRSGDRDAFLAFIEKKRRPLTVFIERNLSDVLKRKIEAADILQEVTITAVKAFADVDLQQRDPFSWLCQLAERRIIDAHRKYVAAQKRSAKREVGLGSSGSESRQGGLIDVLVASITSPSKAFSRGQREFRMLEAMHALPEDGQRALHMRYAEGLPSKEIAEKLGKTDGAVRVLLTRSLAKLQKTLSGDTIFQSFLQDEPPKTTDADE